MFFDICSLRTQPDFEVIVMDNSKFCYQFLMVDIKERLSKDKQDRYQDQALMSISTIQEFQAQFVQ